MAEPDGFIPINPERVVETALALLERETMLAQTVWRDGWGDYRGAQGDTITIRLPAYAVANKRQLRSNDARQRTTLTEQKVDVSLTHDLQVDIPLTDEEITLDIRDFTRDVTAPSVAAIVRGYEQEVADLMTGATYENEVDWSASDPYSSLLDAWTYLNDASVPVTGRYAAVGSALAKDLLLDLKDADKSGSTDALRRASIGAVAGFDNVFVSNYLNPYEGYAYHRTAYALSTRAPFVPQGAAWGASTQAGGFAIRILQHLDAAAAAGPINVVFHDAWVGSNTVRDHGDFDVNGKFVPATDPDNDGGTDLLFVRAVKIGSTDSA